MNNTVNDFISDSLINRFMMTSSNGHIFRVTGHLCGEFTGPGYSPHKGQWRGALMFSLICARINGRVNNGEAGDLRRHRAHCDVIVMCSMDGITVTSYGRLCSWCMNAVVFIHTYIYIYIYVEKYMPICLNISTHAEYPVRLIMLDKGTDSNIT